MNAASQFQRPAKSARSADPAYITLYLGPATKDALKAVDAYPALGTGR